MFRYYKVTALLSVTDLSIGMTMAGVIIFLVPNATEKGIELSRATILSSIFGFGEMTGRPLVALFQTKTRCSAMKISIALTLFCAGTLLVYPFLDRYTVLAIFAFLNGFTVGTCSMLLVTSLPDIIPEDLFKYAFGFIYLCFGIGNALGGYLAGKDNGPVA